MVERYLTIGREHVHESEIKRSRFLCALAPVSGEEAAQEFIARVRKEHAGATHNCFAYVIGAEGRIHRASDDGEPGGTAGTPMLQVLLRREVRDVVAVVTRYYGGVQLGAGGLVRAYGGAVSAALDEVGTVERQKLALVTVVAGHQRAGRIENDLRAAGRAVRGVAYGAAEVRIELGVPQEELAAFRAWLADASAGTAGVEVSGSAFVDV
ncbi:MULTISPECIES: YigZ family protein [Streptomycetaceae]|uniref:YigZ family protein n=1 Tax=Streptomycetaceae TaxID=2062 RepID=UPI000365467D|nr:MULTISPECIES: YigZ family protein [Streptomycetaceae]MDX2851384.1 YigZ family protein [Streptomyces sp. PA03-3a]MYX38563.1 YigZ family protein [Streptomyces sp. SID8377]